MGNSFVPLLFLGIAAVLNVVLDLVFVLVFNWGVTGAAGATVIAQYVSGIGIAIYTYVKMRSSGWQEATWEWTGAYCGKYPSSQF